MGGNTAIPEFSRIVVKDRERVQCARCGTPAPHGEWHHRRSRRIVDAHRHCPCNGLLLCATCHQWAHSNPLEARRTGFIVSIHQREPFMVPIQTVWGERTHDCEGNYLFIQEGEEL